MDRIVVEKVVRAPGPRPWRAVLSMLAAGALASAALGCPDPTGQFEDFAERLANKPAPPAGDCGAQITQTVDGTFFLSLATEFGPTEPIVALVEVSTDAAGMAMILQPLSAADRVTPVGDAIDAPPAPIDAEGRFTVTIDHAVVAAEASDLVETAIELSPITLSGTACADLLCGDMAAQVVAPFTLPLDPERSKFAMERVQPGEDYPEPPIINCLGDLATPLDEL